MRARRFGKTGRRLAMAAALLLLGHGGGAAADEAALAERMAGCAACHGADGNSELPNIPSLAGQPELFLTTQLIYFRERLRKSEVMTPLARELTDDDIRAIAAHYTALPARAEPGPTDARLFVRGRALAAAGRCGTCHLPDFRGRQHIPRLAGQREDYLAVVMTRFRQGIGSGPDTTMVDILRGASDEDIAALAHFLSRAGVSPD